MSNTESKGQTVPTRAIPFGPNHRIELEAFAGQPVGLSNGVDHAPVIGQIQRETPRHVARVLSDGRVLVCTERALDTLAMILPDRATYEDWKMVRLYGTGNRDPETGRELENHPIAAAAAKRLQSRGF